MCIPIASALLPVRVAYNKTYMHIGWKIYCRQRYGRAKEAYHAWHSDGRIRLGLNSNKLREQEINLRALLGIVYLIKIEYIGKFC